MKKFQRLVARPWRSSSPSPPTASDPSGEPAAAPPRQPSPGAATVPETVASLGETPGGSFPASQRRGLHVVHTPAPGTEPNLDVIFIHGLTGDSFHTWNHPDSQIYWPKQLLPHDIPSARVLTYGYDADVAKLFASVGQGALRSHAATLVGDIAALRRDDPSSWNRKIVLVVHSLGGLVAKKALCISWESADRSHQQLDACAVGICFLGTPHRGSEKADLGSIVVRLLKAGGMRVNTRIVTVLQPDSEVLDDLSSSFTQWLRRNDSRFSLACFFEEYESPGLGMIVPRLSAVLDGYTSFPIANNHRDMPKFSSLDDMGYRRIISEIRSWVESDKSKQDKEVNPREPDMKAQKTQELLKLRQDCLKALSFAEMYARIDSIRNPAETTCKWILEHENYQSWFEDGRGVLWLLGHPGTGKSTLMKYAIQESISPERQARDETFTLYFFFYGLGNALERTPEGLLRSLLNQLLLKFPAAVDKLVQAYGQRHESVVDGWKFHPEELLAFLEEGIGSVLKTCNVRLFVDALDECRVGADGDTVGEDVQYVIRYFHLLASKFREESNRFSVCFSCRHYPNLSRVDHDSHIVAERENETDIRSYLQQELSWRIEGDDHALLDDLRDVIGDLANGSFQWVKLVATRAARLYELGKNNAQILAEIRSLPHELSKLYDTILLSVPDEERELSLKIMQWICFTQQPLSIASLRQALNISTTGTFSSIRDIESLPTAVPTDAHMKRMLLGLTGGLVELRSKGEEVDDDGSYPSDSASDYYSDLSSSDSEGDPAESSPMMATSNPIQLSMPPQSDGQVYIYFIHQTVKDYFLKRGFAVLDPEISSPKMASYRGHTLILTSCLRFMTVKEAQDSWDQFLHHYSPDTGYAALKCLYFVNSRTFEQHAKRILFQAASMSHSPTGGPTFEMVDSTYQEYPERGRKELRKELWKQSRVTVGRFLLGSDQPRPPPLTELPPPAVLDGMVSCCLGLAALRLRDYYNTFQYGLDSWPMHAAGILETEEVFSLISFFEELFARATPPMLKFFETVGFLQHQAAKMSNPAVLQQLLAAAANRILPTGRDWRDATPLHRAAASGNIEVVKYLLQSGVPVDCVNAWAATPLLWAAENGHLDVMAILLDNGAKVDAATIDGWTPMYDAANSGDIQMAELLLSHQTGLLSREPEVGVTPFQLACRNDNWKFVEFCLSNSIRSSELPNINDKDINAIISVSHPEDCSLLRLLFDYMPQPLLISSRDPEILCEVIRYGNIRQVKLLLEEYGWSPNKTTSDGPSPLHVALEESAYYPNSEPIAILEFLLGHKDADVNVETDKGTLLYLAINQHIDATTCPLLKAKGIDPNKGSTPAAITPLGFAADMALTSWVRNLLDHPDIDVTRKDNDGLTAADVVRQNFSQSVDLPYVKFHYFGGRHNRESYKEILQMLEDRAGKDNTHGGTSPEEKARDE